MKKRLLGILLTACLLMGLLPTVAQAATATDVSYQDASGKSYTRTTATVVSSSDTTWGNDGNANWYVVNSDVTIENRIIVSGYVHLILADGCTLTANHGIQVESNNGLTIYGQANGTGKLIANDGSSPYPNMSTWVAAIGGKSNTDNGVLYSGMIKINGGVIEATATYGAAIGGGFGYLTGGFGGNTTINGGSVKAKSVYGAGIGGGACSAPVINAQMGTAGGSGGNIIINGGSVEAESQYGAGIGGAYGGHGGGSGGNITINGGKVNAKSTQMGAGIGGGGGNGNGGSGGTVTISGGTVTATGASGIGAGKNSGNKGTFQTTDTGNAFINASSIGDTSNQSSWNCILFDDSSYTVYGNQRLTADLIISEEQELIITKDSTLTIPQGITLINNGIITKRGKLIIEGTLIDNMYYPLSLTKCTAFPVVNINNKTYAQGGVQVTLSATNNAPSNQVFAGWTVMCGTGTVAVNGNTFLMPSGAVSAAPKYENALTITTQPTASQTITYGNTATLSVAVSKHSSVSGTLSYTWYQDGTLISGATNATYTTPADLGVGSHSYYCVISCGSYTATSSTATVKVNPVDLIAEATPNISIDYENETLAGFVAGSSYTINGTDVTPIDGKLSAQNYLGSDISIVTKARDNKYTDSTAQTLTIPARPATPTPSGENETVNGKHDGKIIGVSTAMEYRQGATGSWTACGGNTITDLAPGTYQVRVKATDNSFASLTADVTIGTGDERTYTLNVTSTIFPVENYGYTQPAAQAITITSSGNWQSTITDVTVNSTDFIIGGSGSTVAAGGYINTWTVQPAVGLDVGYYTATVTVAYNNGATTTALVSFTVIPKDITVSITPNGGCYGDITPATAKLNGLVEEDNPTVTLTYTGTANNGTDYNSTTVPTEAGNYTVTASISDSNYNLIGTVSEAFVVTKATQEAPDAPVVKSNTYNSVTLEEIPDNANGAKAQYSIDGGTTWQDSPEFTELTASTEYSFALRFAETDNYYASVASDVLKVTTKATPSGGGGGSAQDTYPPTVEQPEDGDVTISSDNPTADTKVTITPQPDEGYEVDEIIVTDQNGNPVEVIDNGDGTYSFIQPVGKVDIEVIFVEENSEQNSFVDVFPEDYYYDAVYWAVEKGITTGIDDTHFAPNADCTRAEAVTFLWRAAGSPQANATNQFVDVPADSYYAQAVAWAVANGITTGTDATHFNPNDTCDRSQIVTLLWRLAGSPKVESESGFVDVPADSYYAEAVYWALAEGITTGTDATHFAPNADCTRGQIVTFLFRALS